jgi:hypothetical protein
MFSYTDVCAHTGYIRNLLLFRPESRLISTGADGCVAIYQYPHELDTDPLSVSTSLSSSHTLLADDSVASLFKSTQSLYSKLNPSYVLISRAELIELRRRQDALKVQYENIVKQLELEYKV